MTTSCPSAPVDLPEVVKVAEELASGLRTDYDDCVELVLAGLRQRLGFDVAFVGQFRDGNRVVEAVDSDPEDASILEAGLSEPLEQSYCARVADGRLPEFVHDARAQPAVQDLPATRGLPVGTHLSVPIRYSDGDVYGTLCGFTQTPDPGIRERDLGVMRLVARLLARYLEGDRLPRRSREQTREDVEQVIDAGGPAVVYQPVRDLASMDVVGYEALSRFGDGALPDEWFARAASVGMGVELEIAAVRKALTRLPDVPGRAYLAVNLSAAAICSDEMPRALGPLDLSAVVVELTEQTGVTDYAAMRERVGWLRGRGGRVAIDDAGAGYAGLQRILEMSPDVIKLDRALVHDVAEDEARQALVAALTWFARRTGATLVAEGVETSAEVEVLRQLGVPLGQGYHLGMPALLD
ncbi:EAL domain-containing protein [Aquipuribacter hungaricus]|uniref:EAL domain-containing protein n=1 Tax=Aquipuribacter hungaricus TaxID=545624 RepID=A0ABV7WHC1_9MICO